MIAITKDNYSPRTMRKINRGLRHGAKADIAEKTGLPYTTIVNIARGFTYNADVIDLLIQEYQSALAS